MENPLTTKQTVAVIGFVAGLSLWTHKIRKTIKQTREIEARTDALIALDDQIDE